MDGLCIGWAGACLFATAAKSVPSWKFRYMERSPADVATDIAPAAKNNVRAGLATELETVD
jgi:hypothetical protein